MTISWFAGVDEAGRGPLAGSVVAAAVVLAPGQQIEGVTDSKKLTARRRETLYDRIREEAAGWAIAEATAAEIDELNILQASLLAMRRAFEQLRVDVTRVRVDGNRPFDLPSGAAVEMETVVGGDATCPAIGAASILAKVYRDRQMQALHTEYPGYGFDRHKGYPTREHREALRALGPTPEHRRSFRPVREVLS